MVKSADRTLDVFELFARERRPMPLTEISDALKAPLSSCFKLIGALKERGFIYDTGQRRQFYPTRKMLENATITAAHEPWAMQLEPKLARLRDLTQETAILGRLQGDEVIYLAVMEGQQNIRYTAHAGDRKPLYSSSIGKALLSAIDKSTRDAIVARLELKKHTKSTITSKPVLIVALDEVAAKGFAVTRGENVVDVMAVAIPVYVGSELYAVAVAGPMHRMELQMKGHLQHLRALSAELAKET